MAVRKVRGDGREKKLIVCSGSSDGARREECRGAGEEGLGEEKE